MNDLYVVAGATILVIFGFFAISWMQKKGWITSKNIETVLSLDNIERMVIDILPIADKYKDKANFVLDVANETITYVDTYANGTLSEDQKIVLSLKVIKSICEHYGVEPSIQEIELIRIMVKQGIELAGKVNVGKE